MSVQMEERMERRALRLFMAILVLFMMALPSPGSESGVIDVQLTVMKIESTAGGEVFVPAETIRPGDLLQYEIVYRIKGEDEVLELLAQLPIPEGMEYVPDSAQPPKVLGSLGGSDFSPLPLPGKNPLPSGPEPSMKIPPVKYRTLGWTMRGLAPGDEFTVSARLRVNFIPEGKK